MRLLTKSYDGGALYYVLIAAILIALLTGSVYMALGMHMQIDHTLDRTDRVLRNFHSALEIARAETDDVYAGETMTIDLFGNQTDSVEITRKHWGLMEVNNIRSYAQAEEVKRSVMMAYEIDPKQRLALQLDERNRALSLCGNTVIKGNCQLPKAGVRRAYIEGKSFVGAKLINGTTTVVTEKASTPNVDAYQPYFKLCYNPVPEELVFSDSVSTSFWEEQEQWVFLEPGTVSQFSASGQTVLYSTDRVVLDNTVSIEDAIVVAPVIHLASGFTGAGQFLATDSLILDENVTLRYPSVLCINRLELTHQGQLIIKENSSVSGLVVLADAIKGRNGGGHMSLAANSTIRGQVFCESSFDHRGSVEGMVETHSFLLRTPSSVYENHLLDATLDCESLDSHYVFLASSSTTNRNLVKWLY